MDSTEDLRSYFAISICRIDLWTTGCTSRPNLSKTHVTRNSVGVITGRISVQHALVTLNSLEPPK